MTITRVFIPMLLLTSLLGCSLVHTSSFELTAEKCNAVAGCPEPAMTVEGWTREHGTIDGIQKLAYDVFTPGEETVGTLYYFHGLCDRGGLVCSRYDPSALEKVFSEMDPVRVVAVTFDEAWILTPHDHGNNDETIRTFVSTIMPYIERTHGLQLPRIGMGTSMGGFNLATLAILYPLLFDRIVLIHPMIFDCDPHRSRTCLPGLLVRDIYTKEDWAKENPHALLCNASTMPPTYVTACETDIFNLYGSTKRWADLARSRGFPVVFNTDQAGCKHGSTDPQPILEFLKGWSVAPSCDCCD